MTTYMLGDDFTMIPSASMPTGLLKCGVGISETVGVGEPSCDAFEIWLFDKDDIKP